MNSIEDRLRESLRDRATDVDPTPQLWERVQREARRRAQLTWLFAGLGVAAVVGALAVAIPALLADDAPLQPDVVDTPPADGPTDPSQDQTPTGTTGLGVHGMVTTNGEDIVVRDVHGVAQATLLDLDPSACECEIAYLAVSPQSTETDVLVVYTVLAEGTWDQRWLRATGSDLANLTTIAGDYFLGEHAISPDSPPATTPAPAFSPDGDLVAWVEMSRDETSYPLLRVVGFGPTGPRPLPGSTIIGLQWLPNRGMEIEDWTRTSDPDWTGGSLVLTTNQEGLETYRLSVDLTEEGVPSGAGSPEGPLGELVGGGVPLDIADDGSGPAEYILAAHGAGEGTVRFTLTVSGPDGATELPLPAELAQTSDASSVWIDAHSTTVLIGQGGRAWLVDASDGNTVPVPGTASAGALITHMAPPRPSAPPLPEETTAPPPTDTAPTVSIEGLGDVILRDGTGTVTATLYDSPCSDAEDCEFRPARLAVRPGSTVDDLTVLVLWLGDGAELGWIRAVGDDVTPYTPFPSHLQIDQAVVGSGSLPIPVWSWDGRHVAWLEENADTGAFGLKAIGWGDGPGTGDAANDNASWEIDTSGLAVDVDLELVRWQQIAVGDGDFDVASFLLRTHTVPQGVRMAQGIELQRQGDGALALEDPAIELIPGTDLQEVDFDVEEPSGRHAWSLRMRYSSEPIATQATLSYDPGGASRETVDAPTDLLAPSTAGWRLWVETAGAVAYVGNDATARAWRVSETGTVEELEGVRHIAPVQ